MLQPEQVLKILGLFEIAIIQNKCNIIMIYCYIIQPVVALLWRVFAWLSVVWVQGAYTFLRGRNYSPVFSSYNECPVGASPFPPCGNLFIFALSIVHAVCCFFRVHPLLFSTPCGNLFVFALTIVRAVCCFLGGIVSPPLDREGGLKAVWGYYDPPYCSVFTDIFFLFYW